MAKKQGLGRGLSALLGENKAVSATVAEAQTGDESVTSPSRATPQVVPIEMLRPNRYQPRVNFNDDKARELVNSVREKGILQPILVRPDANNADQYEIIAGERRWRAAQEAQLHQVPIVIKELDDKETLEVALIENIQRHDLNPIEEAKGYHRLMEEFDHTQEQLAQIIGKSRSHIANILRLLNLPEKVQNFVADGQLTMGHARALITADHPDLLAETVLQKGLSVRQTELAARQDKRNTANTEEHESRARVKKAVKAGQDGTQKDADTLALEADLSAATGLRVAVNFQPDESGTVTIHYQSLDQLDDLCHRLSHRGL
ncbi:MAG: chromosome partitioning protein ParB [Kordiimonas sp.]|nr:chromosome partitioning protein ParB [Kordiimonas sp.]|tara:strand:- start:1325 stop:2278 length:954 start_codon:yes stop_codon:yes gene_type:complete